MVVIEGFSVKLCALTLIFGLIFVHTDALFGIKRPVLLDPPVTVSLRTVSTKWFDQKLDHFTPTDNTTWKQRYHVNDAYYNETSKNHIFLLLGGEWTATPGWVNYGAWLDTAKQYGALLLYLEHRFYGESHPLGDWSTANLKYLSTPQALEDTANFIEGINNEYNLTTSEVKWIAFGGSYAGTLAAWLRQQYPHLVAGALSSSGPLEAVLDFHEYLEVVKNGMAIHSQACVTNIKSAFTQLDDLVSTCLEDTEIYTELDTAFQLCDSIEYSEGNEKDLANLFEVITDDIFAYTVQYHAIPGVAVSISEICDILVNETSGKTELYRLADANSLLLSKTGQTCVNYKYENLIKNWQNVTQTSSSMMRQWVYQTCTEFGFFQTSSQANPIFGSRFDITFFTDLCQDVFGAEFNESLTSSGIVATNNRYAAKNIAVSNVVYFHGSVDPWHVLGKLESSSDNHSVIVVDGVSHCANMQEQKETDPAGLTAARREIDSLIGQWLDNQTDDGNFAVTAMISSALLLSSLFVCLCHYF